MLNQQKYPLCIFAIFHSPLSPRSKSLFCICSKKLQHLNTSKLWIWVTYTLIIYIFFSSSFLFITWHSLTYDCWVNLSLKVSISFNEIKLIAICIELNNWASHHSEFVTKFIYSVFHSSYIVYKHVFITTCILKRIVQYNSNLLPFYFT